MLKKKWRWFDLVFFFWPEWFDLVYWLASCYIFKEKIYGYTRLSWNSLLKHNVFFLKKCYEKYLLENLGDENVQILLEYLSQFLNERKWLSA